MILIDKLETLLTDLRPGFISRSVLSRSPLVPETADLCVCVRLPENIIYYYTRDMWPKQCLHFIRDDSWSTLTLWQGPFLREKSFGSSRWWHGTDVRWQVTPEKWPPGTLS